jgi:hypothetical protein
MIMEVSKQSKALLAIRLLIFLESVRSIGSFPFLFFSAGISLLGFNNGIQCTPSFLCVVDVVSCRLGGAESVRLCSTLVKNPITLIYESS